MALLLRPQQGPVIRGSGGLRKVRWRVKGQGKRGGLRVIYYLVTERQTFYMLYVYSKAEKGDLSRTQVEALARLVREEFK